MKKQITNYYKLLICTALVIGVYSCQTEQLNSTDDSESSLSSKKNNSKKIEFDKCDFTANEVKLIAGQFMEVGKVTVADNLDGNYKITYTITDNDYCISETHLSVVNSTDGFPMSNGGPKNGQFEYSGSHDCESSVEYLVPMAKGPYIAAHAVVNCISTGSVEDIYASLPESVDFCITSGRDLDDALSYIYLEISDGSLAGEYWAWCADESKGFDGGVTNGDAYCYSDNSFNFYTLNDDLIGIVSQPENMDYALWLINQSDELISSGNYLYGNIQWALWKLLNDQECNLCNFNLKLPPGDITIKGMELYELAITNGDNYSPECGESTLVILDDGVNQPIIIPLPIECNVGECEETAWGAANGEGCEFPGNNWATYFQYAS